MRLSYNPTCRGKTALKTALAFVFSTLLLMACNPMPGNEAPADETSASASPLSSAPPATGPLTTGGDGSAVRFEALSAADLDSAALPGELACSFATVEVSPLLLARGNVANEPSRAVMKVGGHVETLSAPGGFNAMVRGPTLTGKGHTVRINLSGPATGEGESPPRPATLTYDRADGAQVVLEGDWTCGP